MALLSLRLATTFTLLTLLATPVLQAQESNEGNIDTLPLRPDSRAPIQWDVARAVSVDVSCDGQPDTLVLGYQGKSQVWLSVRQGGVQGRPLMAPQAFPVGTETNNAFCQTPVQIQSYPLDCKGADGPIPNCQPKADCQGFTLSDGVCDGFHFYWNEQAGQLNWWRR